MTIATNSPARFPHRQDVARLGKPVVRAARDSVPPTLRAANDSVPPTPSAAHWLRSPALVMLGWQPREIGLATRARSLWARISKITAGVFGRVAEWQERARSRDALLRLSDYELRDIGFTRLDARREINKPFWRK